MKPYIFLFSLLLTVPLFAQDPDWHQVPKDDLLGNRGEIAKTLLTTTDENVMLGIVQRPETDEPVLYLKMLACKRLATHGTKAAIPALVAQLDKEKEGFFARYALETMPGPEVDAALCAALKDLKRPEAIAGVLTTLGVRKNPAAAATVKEFLNHENFDVAQSAGFAYAATGGEGAVEFFTQKNLDPKFADSGFLLAKELAGAGKNDLAIKVYDALAQADIQAYQKESAVYRGILAHGSDSIPMLVTLLNAESPKLFEAALKAGRELPVGEAVTKAMVEQLDKQTDAVRLSLLVRSIGDRTDRESKAVSMEAITVLAQSSVDVDVRIAAIDALRNIGSAAVLPILIDNANQTNSVAVAAAATEALSNLPGKEVDDAIVALLEKGNTSQRMTAIRLIEDRRIQTAFPLLKKALQDIDMGVRRAALEALGQVSPTDDLPVLLEVLAGVDDDEEVKAILNVLKAACTRMPKDTATEKVADLLGQSDSMSVKQACLELLKEIGGPKALKMVESCAWGDTPELVDRATTMLGAWRDPDDVELVAAACLKFLTESKDTKYKVRVIRGYRRLAQQFNMSEERRLAICDDILKIADRDEEKLLVFEVYASHPSLKMLGLAMQHIDNAAFAETAAKAAVTISEKLQGKDPQIADAMKKVIEKSQDDPIKAKAKIVLDRQ